jgi:hypothetical protein
MRDVVSMLQAANSPERIWTLTSRSPPMALHEELDQRLEERLALVETPEYEGPPMTRGDYTSVLLLCAVVPVVLLLIANVLL